ncbi:MAG TPA: NAD(P)/FAD-dependent oxidoreductase, partial [Pyrinomonadaceae bacterium]|nr:NAD(P)/FAD-dependent oxidoreductase [Pyrinomonadaceae bacterium]
MIYDAAIIGGGAAGLFCAITAGRRGRKVVVLEHNPEVGRKILISGGGRCNFTNINTRPENFVSQNPHFAKSALAGFSPQDFVEIVQKHRIPYYEKTLGQLFCRDTSRSIVEMLLSECRAARVEVRTSCTINSVRGGDGFVIDTSGGEIRAKALVVACGGRSFPKIGATDLGYRLARQFGLEIIKTRPSLVAMILSKGASSTLAGVSMDAEVSTGKAHFRENILFTHRGLSGPAILQISNYWQKAKDIVLDLLPDEQEVDLLEHARNSNKTAVNFVAERLPRRFAEIYIAGRYPDLPLSKMKPDERAGFAHDLKHWSVRFRDTEGWDRAEVTLGGVSTDELSSQTMESKKVAGLYFIGEVVDVTGWLGGYTFQWAWAS